MDATFNNLPLYQAVIDDEALGMLRVSLVDCPAVEKDFLAFSKEREVLRFAVADEEKRIVRGVLMRADYPIYRFSPSIGEYYITFSASTIRLMAERYLAEGRANNVNVMHDAMQEVKGCHLVQYFLKDSETGINPQGFEDVADGSLFAEYKVHNDEVWAAIKDGTFRGFSIECNAELEREVFNAVEKPKNNQDTNMFEKIKKTMREALVMREELAQFSIVTTDKGLLEWDGDVDAEVGMAVYVSEGDEERKPAPDGDYKTEEGVIFRVAEGKIAEIIEAAEEEAEETPTEEEQMAEEMPEEEAGTKDDEDELWAMLNDLTKRVEAVEAKMAEMEERGRKAEEQMAELKKQPMAAPAHEEFREFERNKKTGNSKLDNVLRIASAR